MEITASINPKEHNLQQLVKIMLWLVFRFLKLHKAIIVKLSNFGQDPNMNKK